MEDIAVASALPGMSVVAPCDPLEVEAATRWCASQSIGPVYLRLGKAGEDVLTLQSDEPWKYGKIRLIQGGGNEVAILTYGSISKKAIDFGEALRDSGHQVSVFGCHTVKPLDEAGIKTILKKFKRLVIIEEATPTASLGRRIKEIAWDSEAKIKIDAFSLQDQFIHCYGSHDDLLEVHGLSIPVMMGVFNGGKI